MRRGSVPAIIAIGTLSACVTPAQMHTEAQLNDVALGCGLALGELIQDAVSYTHLTLPTICSV